MDSETEIEQQACKFEHILSPEATDKICTFLGHPANVPAWRADSAGTVLRERKRVRRSRRSGSGPFQIRQKRCLFSADATTASRILVITTCYASSPFIIKPTMRRPTIGVFDSGFGGLTVLKALLELIPGADYVYFGDTARLPYGSKSVETVARYAVEAAHYPRIPRRANAGIACNTATALALDRITAGAHVPVIGVVEPGAEAAAAATKNRKIVVIGTEATVTSHAYRQRWRHGAEGSREGMPFAGSIG